MLSALTNLEIANGDIIIDVDGTVPTQPIFQHIGISAWPGESFSFMENMPHDDQMIDDPSIILSWMKEEASIQYENEV